MKCQLNHEYRRTGSYATMRSLAAISTTYWHIFVLFLSTATLVSRLRIMACYTSTGPGRVREGHNLSRLHVVQSLYVTWSRSERSTAQIKSSFASNWHWRVESLEGPFPGGVHVIVTTPAIEESPTLWHCTVGAALNVVHFDFSAINH
jgi:hypothetical protein